MTCFFEDGVEMTGKERVGEDSVWGGGGERGARGERKWEERDGMKIS